jgi:hypothetical protein
LAREYSALYQREPRIADRIIAINTAEMVIITQLFFMYAFLGYITGA